MFTVNNKFDTPEFEYIELVVHCDLKSYRRRRGDGDNWEVRSQSGEWQGEYLLGEIVTECFNSKPRNYSWTQE